MPKFNMRLTKLSDNQNAVRSASMDGWCNEWPQEGQPFMCFGPPIDPAADFRVIQTSLVQSVTTAFIRGTNTFHSAVFTTENSRYMVEQLFPEKP